MTDMNRLHSNVQMNVRVSREQVEAVLSVIYRQPKDAWPELVAALGLDGAPVHLNSQARSKEKALLAVVE